MRFSCRAREVAAEALPILRAGTKAPILYYGHDLHFVRQGKEAVVMARPDKAKGAEKLERIEREVWRAADAVIYLSKKEADQVRAMEPDVAAFAVPGYGFDRLNPRSVVTGGKKILFVAGFGHPPNVDAAAWLVQDILPLVRRRHPDATLTLVGSNPTQEVKALSGEGVEVTGWVSSEELAAHYLQARVAVVPLRFGAGVKLKLVEAMAEGLPVVTTSTGAEGLENIERVVDIEDNAEAIAAALSKWIDADGAAWLQASERQTQYVANNFGRQKMTEILAAAIAAAQRRNSERLAK